MIFGSQGGYSSQLFGWEFDSNNPMNYGLVPRAKGTP